MLVVNFEDGKFKKNIELLLLTISDCISMSLNESLSFILSKSNPRVSNYQVAERMCSLNFTFPFFLVVIDTFIYEHTLYILFLQNS